MATKLTAAGKLILLAVVLGCLIVAIGLTSLYELKVLNHNASSLYNDRVLPLEQLTGIRSAYRDILSFVQDADSKAISQATAESQISAAEKSINENWNLYKRTYLTPDEVELVRRTEIRMNDLKKTIALLKPGLGQKRSLTRDSVVYQEFRSGVIQLTSFINQLIKLQISVSNELIQNTEASYRSSRNGLFLTLFGTLIFAALLSFYVVRDNRRLIRSLEDGNLAIRRSEANYRYLFDNVPAFVMLWDLETLQIISVNDAVVEKYGYSRDEWSQMSVLQYRPEEDHNSIRAFAREMLSGEVPTVKRVWRHIKKNGEVMQMEISSHKLNYEGRKVILSLARDISEQIRIENELIQSREKYYSFFEQASDGIIVADAKGTVNEANAGICRLLLYSHAEMVSKKLEELVDPDELERDPIAYDRSTTGKQILRERRLKKKDGSSVAVEVNLKKISDDQYMIIARDLTERIRTEEQFRAILDYSPENIVLLDKERKILAYNLVMQKTLAAFFEKEIQIGDDYTDFVIPALMAVFLQSFEKAIAGSPVSVELETTNERVSIWFDYKMHPVYNRHGKLLGAALSAKDITERKLAENILRESEEKFRILVEKALVGVYIYQNDRFIYVNPTFERVSGYTKDELLNISFEQLIHESDLAKIQGKYLERVSGEVENDQYTVRVITRHGEQLFVDIIASGIIYHGKPAVIGTIVDITGRIEEEKRINTAVIHAQESERMQIGMELHDNVKQILAASLLNVEIVANNIDDKDITTMILDNLKRYIREAIEELRRLSHQLAPSINTDDSLREKIQWLLSSVSAAKNIRFEIDIEELDELINSDIQIALYRILQEQLDNILKYAHASVVTIKFKLVDQQLIFSVEDDGKGFDTGIRKTGIGLENIRRRVQMLGGKLTIVSAPGKGCHLNILIPCKRLS